MRLNLAHITLGMGIGGLEQCIFHLAGALDRARFHLTIGCLDQGGALLDRLQDTDRFVEHRKPGLDVRLILRLAERFRREGVQIVHTHNQAAHFYAGIAARLARVPVLVCTEHSRHRTQGIRRRILEKRFLYRMTDQWVVVSRELYNAAIEQDRFSPGRLALVPNGIPVPDISCPQTDREKIRKSLGLEAADRMILMAARLDPVKNHGLMLEALARVCEKRPETVLVLAGDGEMRTVLERQAEGLGIEKQVRFLGFRQDVPGLLSASDLFVLCSRSEGLPLSLLEAAAAGVPVLVTPGANRAGFVTHGVNGRVAGADPDALAAELLNLLDRTPALDAMTARAREDVVSRYSVATMSQAYEKIYLDLARQKGLKGVQGKPL